jgi:hypothetical protein
MNRFRLVLVALALLVCASPAMALPKQGNLDLSAGLTFNIMHEADDTVDLTARLGILFTDNLNLGVSASVSALGDDNVYTTFVDGRWLFYVHPQLVPYAGARIGAAYIDYTKDHNGGDNETLLGLGGFGGGRFYVNEKFSIYGELSQTFYIGEDERATGITFGASILF